MPNKIPEFVQTALDDYITCLQQAAPGLLTGCYLHGSLALGAFNPSLSDIDFVAVTSRPCSTYDINALRAVHQTIAQRHPHNAV